MAVCKRCGKSFDYQKREGICPKCCFYNRPAGTWQEDDSWMKNYNYEDNSYEVSLHESNIPESRDDVKLSRYLKEKDLNDVGGRLKDVLGHKEMDGSHTHLDDGRVVKGAVPDYGQAADRTRSPKAPFGNRNSQQKRGSEAGKVAAGFWFFFVIIIYFFIGMFLH